MLKQTMYLSTDKQDEVINAMEYCSAIRSEVLAHTATWVNLESIRLSEKSQTQRLHTV